VNHLASHVPKKFAKYETDVYKKQTYLLLQNNRQG
jgi:hypothetical protein